MRGAAFASLLVLFALAGCMEPSDDDWDAYDSGRGLAFGMLLSVLLIVGIVVLVVNLTSSGRRTDDSVAPPPSPGPSATAPNGSAGVPPSPGGWEPVNPSPAPARKPVAKRSTKSGKPRRPSP